MTGRRSWAAAPLGDHGRRPLFWLVATVLAISAVAVAMLPGGHQSSRRSTHARPTVLGQTPSTATATTPTPHASRPARPPTSAMTTHDQRAALACARRFLAAYLRYEVGAVDASVRRGLRGSTTTEFARELLGDPPRPADGEHPKTGRIDGLELGDDHDARAPSVAATIDRAGTLTPLTVRLYREGDAWLVSGLD